MISPIPFAIAAVPVGMYFVMLGLFGLRRRPLVTTGWRDAAALGIALTGLVAIGPFQLFFPSYAAARFSGWVWGMLLILYLLSLLLIVLSRKPRLIVYGLREESFLQALLAAASRVDPGANWQGQILTLPACGLQLATEPTGAKGVQQAISVGGLTNIVPWMQLEREFAKQCSMTEAAPRTMAAWWLLAFGLGLAALAIGLILLQPTQSVVDLKEFFAR